MTAPSQTYHLKVDNSGRIVLPAETRDRHRISTGDTVVVVDDDSGLRIKTMDEVVAEAQAFFATLAPPDVLLSEEILQDRRSEIERD